MQQVDVLERLQDVFDSTFMDEVKVTPELTAQDVPEWDSLKHVLLVLMIEKEFKIRFHVGEVEGTRNVGELAQLILKKSPGA